MPMSIVLEYEKGQVYLYFMVETTSLGDYTMHQR